MISVSGYCEHRTPLSPIDAIEQVRCNTKLLRPHFKLEPKFPNDTRARWGVKKESTRTTLIFIFIHVVRSPAGKTPRKTITNPS